MFGKALVFREVTCFAAFLVLWQSLVSTGYVGEFLGHVAAPLLKEIDRRRQPPHGRNQAFYIRARQKLTVSCRGWNECDHSPIISPGFRSHTNGSGCERG